jgi:hypothetical protein
MLRCAQEHSGLGVGVGGDRGRNSTEPWDSREFYLQRQCTLEFFSILEHKGQKGPKKVSKNSLPYFVNEETEEVK